MFLKVVFTYTYFGLVPCSLPSTGMFTFKFVEYFIFLTVYTKIFLLARNGHIHPTARIITIIYLTYVARIISFILFCITFTMKISRVFKSCIYGAFTFTFTINKTTNMKTDGNISSKMPKQRSLQRTSCYSFSYSIKND